jgi:hypothetical protein
MPDIFRNPNLTDYFVEHGDTSPLIAAYEAGKVIVLPNLRPAIDHHFWSTLPIDSVPSLKKTKAQDDGGVTLRKSLGGAGVPEAIADGLLRNVEDLLNQVRPAYEAFFTGYRFVKRKVSWRLNPTMNENMHVDTYLGPQPRHFARLFINLDTQPRIWKTSFTVQELYARFGRDAIRRLGPNPAPGELHTMVNTLAFGASSLEWWDTQPRHVIYFAPGDAWIVDSRQVAHQIFYGRRAVSIDFFVDPASMRDPARHYLAIETAFRDALRVAA